MKKAIQKILEALSESTAASGVDKHKLSEAQAALDEQPAAPKAPAKVNRAKK